MGRGMSAGQSFVPSQSSGASQLDAATRQASVLAVTGWNLQPSVVGSVSVGSHVQVAQQPGTDRSLLQLGGPQRVLTGVPGMHAPTSQ
jgi:hypothetical protein